MDLQEAFDAGFVAVKSYIDGTIAAFEKRIAAVEARQPLQGEPGLPGQPGKDADPETIAALVLAKIPVPKDGKDGPTKEEVTEMVRLASSLIPPGKDGKDGPTELEVEIMVGRAVAALTPPKDGEPGKDGKDADPEAITAKVMEKVMAKVSEIRVPKDGENGKDGRDGIDGKDADPEAITETVVDKVIEVVKGIPIPKDGRDGKDGKDGVGLAGAVIDRAGSLVVTLTDGSQKELGPVVGKDGDPGKDGADGMGFDDNSVEFDGERTFKFVFVKGERRKEYGPFVVPVQIYRGVYEQGKSYDRGDTVTWGGSSFVALEPTTEKPETKSWQLCNKRGRDGKDGIMKPPREPGPVKI